jgi:RNA-directed DNA polymerase
LELLRAMLRAGVMEDGQVRREAAGTPQGGVISPVMCNVYLHRLDRAWDDRGGILARYADDLIVMCWSRSQAEAALERLTVLLADLGLEPKAAKTRIVHLEEGGEGFDFLGFHHRLVLSRGLNGKKRTAFLARWPAGKALRHARDRIRDLTGRRRLLLPPEAIAQDVNMFLRGWAGYFRYGHSAARLSKIRQYARMRLALFISKKHRRSRDFGWYVMLKGTPRELGLVSLYGITVAPRAGRPWREKPNAGGERRR